VVISLAMTLIAGGYSPIYAALQGALLALAILLCLRYAPGTLKRSLLWLLVAGLLGGIVAILLMFASPGNTLRQQNFPPPPQLPELVAKNLWGSLAFSALTIAIFAPLGILITMVFSGLTASQLLGVTSRTQVIVKRNRLRLLSLIAVMGFGLINAALLPATYGTSTLPAARGFIIPHFILIFVAVAWGIVMGISVQKPTVTSEHPNRLPFSTAGVVILAILIFIGPIRAAWNTVSVIPELQTFAEEWDQIDREIRAAVQSGVTDLEIAPLLVDMAVHVDVESLSTDADSGFNRCAADYYGLDSLTAPASDPAGDEG
jgi:hypothetical protein